MLKLTIPADIADEIIVQAKQGAPLEICGILAGKSDHIEKLYKMTNTDKSNEHYTMEPQEQFAAIKNMRSANTKMLAIYHSHPETPARPSEEDIRLALTPDVVYIIISVAEPTPAIKGFNIEDNKVTEVHLTIER
ncbi:MAG: M67 family metallopeptidase [Planctomycetes bacterium]|nr:M67 family metallopeptidase [Planctomycetota bacterium]